MSFKYRNLSGDDIAKTSVSEETISNIPNILFWHFLMQNETTVSMVWVVNANTDTHICRTSLHVKYYALQHAGKGHSMKY
jgi:hypothetical protein